MTRIFYELPGVMSDGVLLKSGLDKLSEYINPKLILNKYLLLSWLNATLSKLICSSSSIGSPFTSIPSSYFTSYSVCISECTSVCISPTGSSLSTHKLDKIILSDL